VPLTRTLTALVTMSLAVLAPTGTVGADQAEPAQLQARALAEGLRIGVGMPEFLIVEQFIDGGGPVAESLTNALGTSRAFASLPYPGELGITGPGTAAGLAGVPAPPPYPFYVSSAYPSKTEASFGQDGWKLWARSDEWSSIAVAGAGSSGAQAAVLGSQATATTSRDEATGTAMARADTQVDGFRIGDVISISSVVGSATATRGSSGALDRQSSFQAKGLFVGGQAVGIGPEGLTYPGQTATFPDSGQLLAALKQHGITLTYVQAAGDADESRSAGLLITHEIRSPSGHVVRTTYSFGRAVARVTPLAAADE